MRREPACEREHLRKVATGAGCGCAEGWLRTRAKRPRAGSGLRELCAAPSERLRRRRA